MICQPVSGGVPWVNWYVFAAAYAKDPDRDVCPAYYLSQGIMESLVLKGLNPSQSVASERL